MQLRGDMYSRLRERRLYRRTTITQSYDEKEGMFLPDRFVRGTCPRCAHADQYGDSCEVCGATYSPADLKDPVSVLSGTHPCSANPSTTFFKLGDFEDRCANGWAPAHCRKRARTTRRVVRGGPAGLGYLARCALLRLSRSRAPTTSTFTSGSMRRSATWPASQISARARDLDFDSYWRPDSDAELYHFIGKDIIYFPLAVLAGGTGGSRLSPPERYFCAWISDRKRPENVQVAGDVHHGAHLP